MPTAHVPSAGAQEPPLNSDMSLAVVGRQQMNPIPVGFRMPAGPEQQAVVKHTTRITDESGTQASQHSGATKQQLLSSNGNDTHTAAPPAAPTAAGPAGNQPASPDSVNAGQQKQQQQGAAPQAAGAGHTSSDEHCKAATQQQQQQASLQQGASTGDTTAAVQQPAQEQPDAAAAQHGQQQSQQQQQQQAGQAEELLEPLPPPEESEDPDMQEEYEQYLQRWEAGTTLRQRWHRLQAKGLLSDIQAEWEDWQHDLLLDTIQQQLLNHTAGGTSTAAPGRLRRGRNEMEGSCNAAAGSVSAGGVAQEPRRVRTRRAPASFQDFHVETPATGSPDRHDSHMAAPTAAELQRRGLLALPHQHQHHYQQQQLHQYAYGGADAAAAWEGPARAGQRRQQLQPPPLPRQSILGRQPQQQQQQHLQQPSAGHGSQQGGVGGEVLSEEFIHKFRTTIEMVISSGSAQGMEGAAALLTDPEGLKAFINALRQHTSNPAATLHKLAATLAGQGV